MDEREPADPLKALGERLEKARRGREDPAATTKGSQTGVPQNALGLAFRIGIELVSALVVGIGIGWLIDRGLGTRPWAMVVFFFLGAGAGMLNVYRAINGLGLAAGYRRTPGEKTAGRESHED
jgi:ATP synthase protein I